ncbi:MAG: hypothetical protein BroJett020_11880 [Bacteroidota bacterium]|nr:AtpZ/AtpI family protein [Flavobacteriales bacterium]NUM49880.1 AtpZ/AtpI family protein [Flavobacteriales bacterium]WKZ74951.1 MAG: AtpZ/AtpI family protein [Vicingaceae bacterium]GIK69893.1 MAG: hypothetical protein BroJett020_11880 [Bacteroidota bacterium]
MKKNQPNDFYKYTSMASKMALVILAGVYGGKKIDEKLNLSFPVFTLILSIISVSLAIYIVIKDTSRTK